MNFGNVYFHNWLLVGAEYLCGVIATLLFVKFFRLKGIYALGTILILYMNVAVLKAYNLLPNLQLNAGIFLSPFFVSLVSITTEVYGYKEAKKLIFLGFLTQVIFLFGMLIAIWYIPSAEDYAHEHIKALFLPVWRVTFFSWLAFVTSTLFKAFVQHKLKDGPRLFSKHLALRDNFTSKLAQLVDNSVFGYGALLGIFSFKAVTLFIIWTTLFEWLFDYLDTWVVVKGVRMLND